MTRSTMSALVKPKDDAGLWLEEVPAPEIGINDVLIRVHKTGICGTDLHIYRWDEWARGTVPVPMVIGHEFPGAGGLSPVGHDALERADHDLKPEVIASCHDGAEMWQRSGHSMSGNPYPPSLHRLRIDH